MKLKRDSYRAERGGKAKLIDVICSACGAKVLLYQKDGPGWLKRCYINGIFEPDQYSKLQKDKSLKGPDDMPKLECSGCRKIIGIPSRHKDGRLAFTLIPGSFKRKINKSAKYKD